MEGEVAGLLYCIAREMRCPVGLGSVAAYKHGEVRKSKAGLYSSSAQFKLVRFGSGCRNPEDRVALIPWSRLSFVMLFREWRMEKACGSGCRYLHEVWTYAVEITSDSDSSVCRQLRQGKARSDAAGKNLFAY